MEYVYIFAGATFLFWLVRWLREQEAKAEAMLQEAIENRFKDVSDDATDNADGG